MDRGAWWAAVHRVAQSQTQLKRLSLHACIGEGNGNPLQYSCLENPRDGGASWAAVYRVAQSQTQLKQLSSSSSLSPEPVFSSVQFSHLVVSDSVQPHGQQPTKLLCPQDSLGKNTGVGCHFLPEEISSLFHSIVSLYFFALITWLVKKVLFGSFSQI